MDDSSVERLHELLAKATRGPWAVEADMRSERIGDAYSDTGWREYCAGWNITSEAGEIVGCEGITDATDANAALIVAAVNSLPALLAQSAADRKALDAARGALERIAAYNDDLASAHFEMTGSFSCFDEPGSVEIAREALALSARADPAA